MRSFSLLVRASCLSVSMAFSRAPFSDRMTTHFFALVTAVYSVDRSSVNAYSSGITMTAYGYSEPWLLWIVHAYASSTSLNRSLVSEMVLSPIRTSILEGVQKTTYPTSPLKYPFL